MNMKDRMKGRLKAGLKIEVEDKNEESFVANGEGCILLFLLLFLLLFYLQFKLLMDGHS